MGNGDSEMVVEGKLFVWRSVHSVDRCVGGEVFESELGDIGWKRLE